MTDLDLYSHQQRAAELLLGGKNVILQAPTGAGKTLAALLPWMNSQSYGRDFPKQCIYTVPMRVLANQFVDAFAHLNPKIQTGEDVGDPEFSGDLIFTTIDQALSRFLNYPYGVSKRKANLHAAAVMSAYLVFDEFHLLDPASTLPTALAMLKLLKGITPFMLMTATFSGTMLHELAKELDAEVIPATPEERAALRGLPSQRKTRRYTICTEPLAAERVFQVHDTLAERRSIVICNTVVRARAIFDELRRQSPDTEVILLHSQFLPADRKAAQDRLVALFGKGADRQAGSAIAVATQAIEVGVDITSTALHTELAPANSIIQRAGRCARYEGESGEVTIYRYSCKDGEPIDLTENPNPYASQKDVLAKTWSAFSARDGQEFSFEHEQEVLTEVHGDSDREIVAALKQGEYEHKRQMFDVMGGLYNVSNPSDLIRNVFQARVTISDNPDSLLESPFDAPAFGLHPGSLQKAFKELESLPVDRPFTMKYLYVVENDKAPSDSQTYRRTEYCWEPVRTGKDILGAALLAVHPSVARYDAQRGLVLGQASDPDGWQASIPATKLQEERANFTYTLETYARHIELVYDAAFGPGGSWDRMAGLAKRLERRFGWAPGDVRRAAEQAVLLHDVGKLSVGWQNWVREYQDRIGRPVAPGEAYAHTESQTREHGDIEKSMKRRPTHAVEGALAAMPIYAGVLGEDHPLALAIYSAIARHHAPFADTNGKYGLIKGAIRHVATTLNAHLSGVPTSELELIEDAGDNADPQHDNIAKPDDGAAYWAYLLLARVLRLADQEGTRLGTIRG
ncbi:MAG: CRISPR-associated helicase Cas3' [Chloroflexi bacterium]|nr:CRISPR-associated helicase Cas3' [Chloroflexota bacterium]